MECLLELVRLDFQITITVHDGALCTTLMMMMIEENVKIGPATQSRAYSYRSNFVYNRRRCHGVDKASLARVLAQYFAHGSFVARGAVPLELGELVLALAYAVYAAVDDLRNDGWLTFANVHLFGAQPVHLAAYSIGIHHEQLAHEPVGSSTKRTKQ